MLKEESKSLLFATVNHIRRIHLIDSLEPSSLVPIHFNDDK